MAEPAVQLSKAILVATRAGAQKRLAKLLTLLSNASVATEVVESPKDLATHLLLDQKGGPVCVLVDATDAAEGLPSKVAKAREQVAAIVELIPGISPVAVAADPVPGLIIECFRAGAGDFIDLSAETGRGIKKLLGRIAAHHADRTEQQRRVVALRQIVEEFLRDLVQTERRSIDLEHRLRMVEQGPTLEPTTDLDRDRQPTVFVVEDDREVADLLVEKLESRDIATYAFTNGEEAIRDGEKMSRRGEAIDLAIVDIRLPGIDGLDTIRRLREVRPGLAAMLMTGYSDKDTAASAADLGVVGYVLKPFDDVGGLIERIREQAEYAMNRARERLYLERIKERHEDVLTRYRQLAAELERLV